MVYNLTSNLYAVLGQIAHIEATTRTDGKTPLLDRVCEVIFNLDKQPNKTSVILPIIPTRVIAIEKIIIKKILNTNTLFYLRLTIL